MSRETFPVFVDQPGCTIRNFLITGANVSAVSSLTAGLDLGSCVWRRSVCNVTASNGGSGCCCYKFHRNNFSLYHYHV